MIELESENPQIDSFTLSQSLSKFGMITGNV